MHLYAMDIIILTSNWFSIQAVGDTMKLGIEQTLLSSTCKYPFESRALMERNLQKCVLK